MRTIAGLLVVALYVECFTDLESQISGSWYLRMPPTFAADERYRMTIRDGVIAFTSTGLIWAAYDVVDDRTIRLTEQQTSPQRERLLTVRIEEDGESMGWYPTDTAERALFILTKNADEWTAGRP
jgi:hypothetical protein